MNRDGVPHFHQSEAFLGGRMLSGDIKAVFHRSLNLLRAFGFVVGVPPDIEKNYRSLRRTHFGGIWKHLEFHGNVCPWKDGGGVFKFEFFQNLVFENPHGGEYDFGKVAKMPYLVRLRFVWVTQELKALWRSIGLEDQSKPDEGRMTPLERISHHISTCWHFTGGDPLTDWKPKYASNGIDREGRNINPGDTKYFYSYRGHLMVGRAYYNLNNMWWVHAGAEVINVSSRSLFDWQDGTPRRKEVDPQPKLKQALSTAVKAQNFERAIVLRDLLKGEVAA